LVRVWNTLEQEQPNDAEEKKKGEDGEKEDNSADNVWLRSRSVT
jgi:hypothetical protein